MLSRPLNKMPSDIKAELERQNLCSAYDARPPYQRNDYLGWILKAKRPQTRAKRTAQMLSELKSGKSYMGMRRGK
jgi:uncharacterized protein YdeI (YjbR/CyaY-like superfamily)